MHSNPRVAVVFDLDSTLIQQECIDELARAHGVYGRVSEITKRAMRGELDFVQSLTQRVQLLRGLTISAWGRIFKDNCRITPGAKELVDLLHARNPSNRAIIASGGFIPVAAQVSGIIGADAFYANQLEEHEGAFTGRLSNADIVDAAFKARIVQDLQSQGYRTVAIGDGSNDIPMFAAADVSIAVHDAKPKAKQSADHVLQSESLLEAAGYIFAN